VYSCYRAAFDLCTYCKIDSSRTWIENEHAIALADSNPITDGHVIILPRKHVGTIYELTALEQEALWQLVSEVRGRLLTGLIPDGFSIGFNDLMHDGVSANHAAISVVPRRRADGLKLPGGIDWVTDDHLLTGPSTECHRPPTSGFSRSGTTGMSVVSTVELGRPPIG
jgi:diadenosine tetraphosphate (Ap4A) HIT family hydrolase